MKNSKNSGRKELEEHNDKRKGFFIMAVIADIIYNAQGEPLAPSQVQINRTMRNLPGTGGTLELEPGYIYAFSFTRDTEAEVRSEAQRLARVLESTGYPIWFLDENIIRFSRCRYQIIYAIEDPRAAEAARRTAKAASRTHSDSYRRAAGSARAPERIAA